VKALVELGLHSVLAEKKRASAFRLRKTSFRGNGLQPGAKDADWERLRSLVLRGPGRRSREIGRLAQAQDASLARVLVR
jgi:hypothetical protein